MGRIANIITRVRDSLSDPNGSRWTDNRLLRLIDEAQVDIAVHAKLLRSKTDIQLIADIAEYELPAEAFSITRAIVSDHASTASDTDLDRYFPMVKSHRQMDELDPEWESVTGDGIEAIVFDRLNAKFFKVYPIPTVSDAVTAHTFSSDYGVTAASSGDSVDAYGVPVSITESATLSATWTSPYGVITDMTSGLGSIRVYYNRRPTEINNIAQIDTTQTLEIDEIFDKAIKHYVVGMCLRDNQDTQNRQFGAEELELYARELKLAMKESSENFMAAAQHHTTYNPGI